MSYFKGFHAVSPSPPKYFWHWLGTERVSQRPKYLILLEFDGAVDGARNRYFMSSGGSWWPSTATMVGFLASGGVWWTATAGTGLALQCQVILGTEHYSMIGRGLGFGMLEMRCVC